MTASPSPLPADQVEAAQVLAPCPFGCVEIELVEIDAGRPPHFVVCHGCGAEGPPRLTMADAAEAWNSRPVAALRPVAGVAPEGMREGVAKVVARAVNTALAGAQAPGRLDPKGDGALYFADAILAALPPASGSDHGPVASPDTAELRGLLRAVADFLAEESENRQGAGALMTDYEDEPEKLLERVRSYLAAMGGGT